MFLLLDRRPRCPVIFVGGSTDLIFRRPTGTISRKIGSKEISALRRDLAGSIGIEWDARRESACPGASR
jgi:hypothetical protein